jgi:hypothetical protein
MATETLSLFGDKEFNALANKTGAVEILLQIEPQATPTRAVVKRDTDNRITIAPKAGAAASRPQLLRAMPADQTSTLSMMFTPATLPSTGSKEMNVRLKTEGSNHFLVIED